MSNRGDLCLQKLIPFISIILVLSFFITSLGIYFLSTQNVSKTEEKVIDYTFCKAVDGDECFTYLIKNSNQLCTCVVGFELEEPFFGVVDIYYELEKYDQNSDNYNRSRDDVQLSGRVLPELSENCEPYRYDNGKPIAPCGAIANSFFNDSFADWTHLNKKNIFTLQPGILSDEEKVGYRNPPNITEIARNYARPKNWDYSIWEFDANQPDNNGYQNERFIGWMKTDLKRKPLGRVNTTDEVFKNGLEKGKYEVKIIYYWPPQIYKGSRSIIITATEILTSTTKIVFGSLFLILGIMLLALFAILINMRRRITDNKNPGNTNEGRTDPAEANPLASTNRP